MTSSQQERKFTIFLIYQVFPAWGFSNRLNPAACSNSIHNYACSILAASWVASLL